MKISLNANPIMLKQSSSEINLNRKNQSYAPQFTGSGKAGFAGKFYKGVGTHFCRYLFDNKLIDKIAYSIRNSENAIKHFLTVGSVITSGMYMKKTLTNDKMDKDRRHTLAVNQGFTLIISTIGAYTLDSKIKKWWDKKHEQFMKLSENGTAAWKGMENRNNKIRKENAKNNTEITNKIKSGEIKPNLNINSDEELLKIVTKFIKKDKESMFSQRLNEIGIKLPQDPKEAISKLCDIINGNDKDLKNKLTDAVKAEDYVRKIIEPTLNIDEYLERYGKNHVFTDLEKLKTQSKGFAALRSILVFGFIYRFFVPLAVVKPTNILCEKYLAHKKQKEAEAKRA